MVLWVIMAGCVQKSFDMERKNIESPEPPPKLTIAEQQKKAYEILEDILRLTNAINCEDNIPEIKARYRIGPGKLFAAGPSGQGREYPGKQCRGRACISGISAEVSGFTLTADY